MDEKTEDETTPVTEADLNAAGIAGNSAGNPPVLDPVPIGDQTGIDGIPVGVGGDIGEIAGLQGDPAESDSLVTSGGMVVTGGGLGQAAGWLKSDTDPAA